MVVRPVVMLHDKIFCSLIHLFTGLVYLYSFFYFVILFLVLSCVLLLQMYIIFHVAKAQQENLAYQNCIIVLVKICRGHLILQMRLLGV